MAINKVVYGTDVLIDLTSDTVTSDKLATGYTAHDKSGNPIVGTAELGGEEITVIGYEVGTATAKSSSNAQSLTFTGLNGEPKAFSVKISAAISKLKDLYVLLSVDYNGQKTAGIYTTKSGPEAMLAYSESAYAWTYNNGTLTITSASSTNGGYFYSGYNYTLNYVYEKEGIGGAYEDGTEIYY